MTFNPDIHHRRSVRLHEHDYSRPGWYFITLLTNNRECLFGEIAKGEMELNELGKIIHIEWSKSAEIRMEIELDAFVVMPNHLHGIIIIKDVGHDASVRAHSRAPLHSHPPLCHTSRNHTESDQNRSPLQQHALLYRRPKSIGSFVAGFKSAATKHINHHRNTPYMPVWQRNYWEHIIRNESDLHKIREYIVNNPLQWTLDEENPDRTTGGI